MTDNEIITEFMRVPTIHNNGVLMYDYSGTGKAIYALPERYLRYHEKWDWLMPVVEKISKLYEWVEPETSEELEQATEQSSVCMITIDTPIEMVYERVVDFIKWYNSQQK